MNKQLTCAITMGDPAGIGPEVILKALADKKIQRLADFLVIGNSQIFKKTAQISKIDLNNLKINFLDIGDISKLVFGKGIAAYGLTALDCLNAALELIKLQKVDVLVTAPVNKHAINQVENMFKGHSEYLAAAAKTKNFAMMLIGGRMKVVLVTRHLALKDVAKALTKEKIYQTLRLTAQSLKTYFGIAQPRIAVCGLNPHSGEQGMFGKEEIKIIRPAVIKAKKLAALEGPLPADTLFYCAGQGKFDAVVAMYHDQGLIPLKMQALHQGVNLTLGLPFVRTSPDHGTAYDIAGKNQANPGSMMEAIKLAIKIGAKLKQV